MRLPPSAQILDPPENNARDKRSSLFCRSIGDEEKSFMALAPGGLQPSKLRSDRDNMAADLRLTLLNFFSSSIEKIQNKLECLSSTSF